MTSDHVRAADLRALWNERYRSEPVLFGDEPNQFVAAVAADYPPGTALDVACGRGRNAVWLASRGHTVTAIDISDVGIEQGRALAARRGLAIEWIRADFSTWSSPEAGFDLVLLSYLQLPAEPRVEAHRRAAAALAPGGRVLLIAHHTDNLEQGIGGPDDPAVLYDEAVVAADFAGLEVERSERVLRHVDRADVQGTAIDLLFVARNAGV